jgi:hypothetical protein
MDAQSGADFDLFVSQGSDDWRIALTELSRTVLTLLQQYRWELEEIQSGKFLEDVEEFKEALPESETPLALDRSRRSFYQKVTIKKEKSYLRTEAELKSMITVLTEAIATLSHGNENYHDKTQNDSNTRRFHNSKTSERSSRHCRSLYPQSKRQRRRSSPNL